MISGVRTRYGSITVDYSVAREYRTVPVLGTIGAIVKTGFPNAFLKALWQRPWCCDAPCFTVEANAATTIAIPVLVAKLTC